MEIIIYKIENPVKEIYIGSTERSLGFRKAEHKYCAKKNRKGIVYDSIREYGFDNHVFEILTKVNIDENKELEHFIIDVFKPSLNMVENYNATAVGKIWITNGIVEFQVLKSEFEKYKLQYKKGRLRTPFKKINRYGSM